MYQLYKDPYSIAVFQHNAEVCEEEVCTNNITFCEPLVSSHVLLIEITPTWKAVHHSIQCKHPGESLMCPATKVLWCQKQIGHIACSLHSSVAVFSTTQMAG
jgi:hypothetical protein